MITISWKGGRTLYGMTCSDGVVKDRGVDTFPCPAGAITEFAGVATPLRLGPGGATGDNVLQGTHFLIS